jgi:hypothetical protein
MNNNPKSNFSPEVVVYIFNEMKKDPKKIFLKADFSTRGTGIYSWGAVCNALRLLERLEIVEVVTAIYKYGKKYRSRKEVKGYKIKEFVNKK